MSPDKDKVSNPIAARLDSFYSQLPDPLRQLLQGWQAQFLAAHLHLAPPEPLKVRQRGVGTDTDPVRLGQAHGLAHVVKVRAVKTAGDIRHRDQRHQPLVIAQPIKAKGFAHIAVDAGHCVLLGLIVGRFGADASMIGAG